MAAGAGAASRFSGLSFSAPRVEVVHSADLAWEHGTYEFATLDEKGATTVERGTYVTVGKTAGRRLESALRPEACGDATSSHVATADLTLEYGPECMIFLCHTLWKGPEA